MSKNTARTGAGDVEITLDGEVFYLKPTLAAAMTVSRQAGGIQAAINRCVQYDFDTIRSIVALGLGQMGQGSKDLPEKIWRTGLMDLAPLCIRYLHIVANGGRPPEAEQQQEEDGAAPLGS